MRPTAAICLCVVFSIVARGEPNPQPGTASPRTPERLLHDLPDWSFAGYGFGSEPPRVPVVVTVTDFGAVGDGATDSTDAFRRAIEAAEDGAILIPAGKYVLSDILWIRKPGIVLRGEGKDRTVLIFPRELEDVRPNMSQTSSGSPTSGYSWSGGFIWVQGGMPRERVAGIEPAARGDRSLTLDAPASLVAGELVEVTLDDDEQRTLLDALYSGDPGNTTAFTKPVSIGMVTRVIASEGNSVTLERPLRLDARASWRPALHRVRPTVRDVGIEDLAIEFPLTPYKGHFTERGRNAIAMSGVLDCWIRNVRITNADSGIFLHGTHCTIEGVVLESQRQPDRLGNTGHHGLTLGRDCLLTGFAFDTKFIHDITVSNLSTGNVTRTGRAVDLSLDHHKRAPFQNLFTDLDAGIGSRLWDSGGGANLGRHAGAQTTFWNIRASKPLPAPRKGFAPRCLTLVGMRFASPGTVRERGWTIQPGDGLPADLHEAQVAARRAHKDGD